MKSLKEISEEIVTFTLTNNPYICKLMDIVIPRLGEQKTYNFVESGVFIGESSRYFMARLILDNIKFNYHALDNFKFDNMVSRRGPSRDYRLMFLEELEKYEMRDLVTTHTIDGSIGHTLFEDKTIDFLLIDDFHEYNHLKQEIKDYIPKITKGGIMVIDDMNAPPLRNAVIESFGDAVTIIDECVAYIKEEDFND